MAKGAQMISEEIVDKAAQSDTISAYKERMFSVVRALATRAPGETIESVADRAGVSRRSIYRYMEKADFAAVTNKLIGTELNAARVRIIKAVLDGAVEKSPQQPAMAKLALTLTGDYKDQLEINGRVGIDVNSQPVPLEKLSVELKGLLYLEMSGNPMPDELKEYIAAFMSKVIGPDGRIRHLIGDSLRPEVLEPDPLDPLFGLAPLVPQQEQESDQESEQARPNDLGPSHLLIDLETLDELLEDGDIVSI